MFSCPLTGNVRHKHSAMSDSTRSKSVRINRIIHFALKLSFFQFRFLKICTLLVFELQVRLLHIYSPITIYLADVILWLLSRQSPVMPSYTSQQYSWKPMSNLNVTKRSVVCTDLFQIKFTYTLNSNGKSQRMDTNHWEALALPITWVSYCGVNSYNTKVVYN